MSVNTKLKRTETCVNVFKVLLNNISETEHAGIKKIKYRVLIIPGRALDGIVISHSYFLFNSEKNVEINNFFDLFRDMNIYRDRPIDIDYLIQAVLKGSSRESIYNLNIIRTEINRSIKDKIVSDKVPVNWEEIVGTRWFNCMKNFKDCGLIYSDKKYDFYLFQRKGNILI